MNERLSARAAFFEHPFVTSIVLAAMASAIAGGVTSFIAILRTRERSLFVFASLGVAIFVFLFTLAEFTVEGRQ
jgi:drug/metabolite transporter superfamily protein YnfA